eukprot:629659-Prorocentrum_minimum.AAC.1
MAGVEGAPGGPAAGQIGGVGETIGLTSTELACVGERWCCSHERWGWVSRTTGWLRSKTIVVATSSRERGTGGVAEAAPRAGRGGLLEGSLDRRERGLFREALIVDDMIGGEADAASLRMV